MGKEKPGPKVRAPVLRKHNPIPKRKRGGTNKSWYAYPNKYDGPTRPGGNKPDKPQQRDQGSRSRERRGRKRELSISSIDVRSRSPRPPGRSQSNRSASRTPSICSVTSTSEEESPPIAAKAESTHPRSKIAGVIKKHTDRAQEAVAGLTKSGVLQTLSFIPPPLLKCWWRGKQSILRHWSCYRGRPMR
jgi:hypothetical protein